MSHVRTYAWRGHLSLYRFAEPHRPDRFVEVRPSGPYRSCRPPTPAWILEWVAFYALNADTIALIRARREAWRLYGEYATGYCRWPQRPPAWQPPV